MRTRFDWSDLKVLLAFGRAGTLADAAVELGMDETTAARRMKRLEQALGFPLTARGGNKLRLTSAGKIALERAQAMELAAEDLERIHAVAAKPVTGTVRITSLGYVLNDVVIPALPAFMAMHPGISIHIQNDNRNLSLEKRETDIAIRMGAQKGALTVSEKVAELAFAAYRPRNRFQGVPPKRCQWIGSDAAYRHIAEAAWLEDNIPEERISMRSNSNACNAAAVRSGLACAVLPSLIGDNDKDMVRMDVGVVVRREIWIMRRADIAVASAVGVTVQWMTAHFRAIASQLAG